MVVDILFLITHKMTFKVTMFVLFMIGLKDFWRQRSLKPKMTGRTVMIRTIWYFGDTFGLTHRTCQRHKDSSVYLFTLRYLCAYCAMKYESTISDTGLLVFSCSNSFFKSQPVSFIQA